MKRYWFPRVVRDLATDFDYLDKLNPEEREWFERWRAEYYNGDNHGISAPAHRAESSRVKTRLTRDLYSSGLRADGERLTCIASAPTPVAVSEDMQRPEVLAILEELRALRPQFDDADGRRPARFATQDAELRFHTLRAKLQELLR